ncbi:hypothetical protein DRB89_39205 [Streptomyces sp. ICC4]|nr:hypothetical protein DRB89_39205 [Streptomyces sp. ICC4]
MHRDRVGGIVGTRRGGVRRVQGEPGGHGADHARADRPQGDADQGALPARGGQPGAQRLGRRPRGEPPPAAAGGGGFGDVEQAAGGEHGRSVGSLQGHLPGVGQALGQRTVPTGGRGGRPGQHQPDGEGFLLAQEGQQAAQLLAEVAGGRRRHVHHDRGPAGVGGQFPYEAADRGVPYGRGTQQVAVGELVPYGARRLRRRPRAGVGTPHRRALLRAADAASEPAQQPPGHAAARGPFRRSVATLSHWFSRPRRP